MKNLRSRSPRRTLLTALVGFLAFIGVVGLSLASVDAASAVTPQSGPKGNVVYGSYKGKPLEVQTMLFRVDLNGETSFMFCIDINTPIEFGVPYTETDWSESQVTNLTKVARVLSQTTATSTHDPIEIAAAQAAIWHFSDGFELDVNNTRNSPYVVARYQALVADANANPVSNEPTATLSVTPESGSASYGQPVFFDVASTTDGPIAIELSDSLVAAHPANGEQCDTVTTIATTTAGSRICLTSASPRSDVKLTLRTQAAPLSAGRVFVKPNRQKLIIGKAGAAQSNETVSASWSQNGRPTVSVVCPTGGVRYGETSTYTAQASDPDNDGLRYQWSVNGTPVEGAQDLSFDHVTQPGDEISVTVTDSVGQSATAVADCASSTKPTVALACPTQVIIGADNTFTATATDPEDDVVRFEWTLNGAVIAGVDGPTFTAVINAGDDLRVRAIDAAGNASDQVVASCIPTEVNEPPEVTLSCPDPMPAGGGNVTYVAHGTDRNGDELTYTWYLNDQKVDGVTGAELTVDVVPGDRVSVAVNDGTTTSDRVEADCVIPGSNQPPVVALTCPTSVLYGEPTVFSATGSDPDGDPIEYRWFHNDVEDPAQRGAQATFVLAEGDSVSVIAVDTVSGSESTKVTVDCAGKTRPTVTITCPINLIYGEPVTFIANGSNGDDPSPLTYRWALNGVPIDDNMTARLVIVVNNDDVLTVSAMSQDEVVSATASADCVGNTRPSVTLTCPESLLFDRPTEFNATGTDADGDELTYEWRIDDEVVDGETGATATLTVAKGQRVSVRVNDGNDAWSEAATSTCVGTSVPQVRLECPPNFYFGEPVTLRAVGTDDDGDSLQYRWSVNGVVVEGETDAAFTTVLNNDDVVTVEAIDPSGNVSASATFDCAVGSQRPVVTLECASNAVYGSPITVTASVSGVEEGAKVVYTWAVNNVVIDGTYGNSVSVVLKPDDVVAVTATAGAHSVSKTVGTNCTSVPPAEVPQVPSVPQVLSNQVRSTAAKASRSALAYTGSSTMLLVGIGAAATALGGVALVLRRRFRPAD